ncbi:MAG: YggS family pyridoxal phosphate-dependent enzyme [Candidatus Omnitrophota bacterium]|nr:YggS family pyridoxal phosphate-dependent enzyme [Candidatus Omnitrophota bacterium]
MIRENILEVRRRIESACLKVKRDPAAVKLVVVSKNRSVEEIGEAFLGGITEFGENRVQEALLKYNDKRLATDDTSVKWHMVGHLQTNKVKEAVKIFDLIQSVDSPRLAEEIDKQAAKINKIQEILIEVKTSLEATKSGIKPDETIGLIKEISEFKNIKIKGLMTIAPAVGNPEEVRPYFRQLRELRNEIKPLSTILHSLSILSMGMTDDFEIAIEEGSDMLRIGRAIFEGII